MSSLSTISQLYKKDVDNFLNNLLNGEVIIDEYLQGNYFAVQFINGIPTYFDKKQEISLISRTCNSFYEKAIILFDSIPLDVRYKIPFYLKFCFSFNPAADTIEKMLRLTHIKDVCHDISVSNDLQQWVEFFKVGYPPVLFSGTLNNEQKSAILSFVYASPQELAARFKSESFTRHILNVLNPEYPAENIDGIVFRFKSGLTEYTAKLIDPLFADSISHNNPTPAPVTDNGDMVHVLIMKVMTFINTKSIEELQSYVDPHLPLDQNYLRMMNKIFVQFVEDNKVDLFGIELTSPSYMKDDINLALIDNEDAVNIIEMMPTFREVYKIIISTFKKKKRPSDGMFNPNMTALFNNVVAKIFNVIANSAKIQEDAMTKFENDFESISEALDWVRGKAIEDSIKSHKDRQKVNLIIDNFQPINNLHLKIAGLLKNRNKLNTVLVVYNKQMTIPLDAVESMIKRVLGNKNTDIIDYVVVNDNSMKTILSAITVKYDPIILAASSKMVDDYVLKLEYARKHNTLFNIGKNFKTMKMPELSDDSLVQCIQREDFEAYKSKTPTVLHGLFFDIVGFFKK